VLTDPVYGAGYLACGCDCVGAICTWCGRDILVPQIITFENNVVPTGYTGFCGPDVVTLSVRSESIPDGAFNGLTNLKTLSIFMNSFKSFPIGVFDRLYELVELQIEMENDAVESLPAGVFDSNTALEEFSYRRGSLTSLPSGVFDNNVKLVTVDLSFNQLASLPTEVFDKNLKLAYIDFRNNKLTSLPAGVFDKNPNLKTIDFLGNKLTSLPAGVFDKNLKLGSIDLYNNQLTSIAAGVFDNNMNLGLVNLKNNQIAVYPACAFKKMQRPVEVNLVYVYLDEPPSVCPIGSSKVPQLITRFRSTGQSSIDAHCVDDNKQNYDSAVAKGYCTINDSDYSEGSALAPAGFTGLIVGVVVVGIMWV
jgi:hypothetical protein